MLLRKKQQGDKPKSETRTSPLSFNLAQDRGPEPQEWTTRGPSGG